MILIHVQMEDSVINASYNDGAWTGTMCNVFKGVSKPISWTEEQMAAVLALGLCSVGENNTPGYDAKTLYAVADPIFAGENADVRCIP